MEQLLNINTKTTRPARAVNLTPTAVTKVQELIETEGDGSLALRMAVRPGGCSGFSYEMFFDGDVGEADQVVEFDGVKVVVDSDSAPHLEGAEVDYRDGLQGAGFAINNPNVSRTCGCGSSFS